MLDMNISRFEWGIIKVDFVTASMLPEKHRNKGVTLHTFVPLLLSKTTGDTGLYKYVVRITHDI